MTIFEGGEISVEMTFLGFRKRRVDQKVSF